MTPGMWLDELNPRQKEAVLHQDGPLLVVAGAGSGKTKTLAYRVASLISRGVNPERILLLTFTRRAAQEMLKRAAGAISTDSSSINRVWGGTFHAAANRLLRTYARQAGLGPDFTIMDQSDAEDLIDVIRHEKDFSSKESRFPRKSTCLAIYSRRVNGNEPLDVVLSRWFPWCRMWQAELVELFKAYVERKQRHQVLDYDDLLLYWYYLVQDEATARSIEERFDHVLVDEYQDTNRIQAGILAGMRRANRNIMVVGDDAQSIYSFRSATVYNMLEFPQRFPGTTTVLLEQNYRSVEPILVSTNLVIAQAKERFSKNLWSTRSGGQRPQLITCKDEDHQDEVVIRKILEHREQGIALRKQAVLFRTAYHSNSLELALTRKNIPYVKYGGLRFLEAAHIKDLVCFLRILENPQDQVAWFRILKLLDGVGPVTAAAGFAHVAASGFDPRAIGSFSGPAAAREEIAALGKVMDDLAQMRKEGPSPQIDRIRRFYAPIMKRAYENGDARTQDLEHLGQLASRYRSRRSFLTELVLDPPSSTGDLAQAPSRDEDWLVLSTIHSAKGCEWDAVYVIHAADGCLPSDMAAGSDQEIEEELRLTYVALTRARDFLYVLWPLRYYHRRSRVSDSHSYAQCCRFFTPQVRLTFEEIGYVEPGADTQDGSVGTAPVKDIASRIKGLWDEEGASAG